MNISIVICTYNRANVLKNALESLAAQRVDSSIEYEVVVVDNNSDDSTKIVTENAVSLLGTRLKYCFEPQQGLNHARNQGVRSSSGDIIVYTDDDVIFEEDWINNIWEFYQTHDADAMGGRVLPQYEAKVPKWIKNNLDLISGPVLNHDYGVDTKLYDRSCMFPFVGANMSFKRSVFKECGLFREDIGCGYGTMGDDTEYFNRLSKQGKKIYYCGKAMLWHPVDFKRMNLRYIAKWNLAFGRYLAVEDGEFTKEEVVHLFGMPRYLFARIVRTFFKACVKVFDTREFLKEWIYLFRNIGHMDQYRKSYIGEVK